MKTPGKAPVRCPECSSTEITEPDSEVLIDCCGCGIWFNPNHPNNVSCFDGPDPQPVSHEEGA